MLNNSFFTTPQGINEKYIRNFIFSIITYFKQHFTKFFILGNKKTYNLRYLLYSISVNKTLHRQEIVCHAYWTTETLRLALHGRIWYSMTYPVKEQVKKDVHVFVANGSLFPIFHEKSQKMQTIFWNIAKLSQICGRVVSYFWWIFNFWA